LACKEVPPNKDLLTGIGESTLVSFRSAVTVTFSVRGEKLVPSLISIPELPIDRTVIERTTGRNPGASSFDDEFLPGDLTLATNCPSGPETAWART